MRERFKHLVGICTVKPAKAAPVQPLQRKLSSKPTPQSSQVQLPGRDHALAHQSSTLFTPDARPATAAAAARRKRANTNRPTTASAGDVIPFACAAMQVIPAAPVCLHYWYISASETCHELALACKYGCILNDVLQTLMVFILTLSNICARCVWHQSCLVRSACSWLRNMDL